MDDNILQKIEDNKQFRVISGKQCSTFESKKPKQFRVISGKQCSTFESKKQYYQPKHE